MNTVKYIYVNGKGAGGCWVGVKQFNASACLTDGLGSPEKKPDNNMT